MLMSSQPIDRSLNSPRPWTSRCFGIDPRSLAVFRIAIGVLLLVDLAIRAPDLGPMYSADGVMPLDAVKSLSTGRWCWSIYWLSGSVEFQSLLFAVAAVFALMFLLGFHTRLATIACWVLLLSLHRRGPLVINAGDSLMRHLLFWSMFLPLGQVWSLDARRQTAGATGDGGARTPVVGVASAAILLQVCLMYWFTAIFKFEAGWGAGPGLQNALEWGGYNKPLGDVLLRAPALMSALSIATVWLELIGPVLTFFPWFQVRLRWLVIVAFWMLHAGIELTMHVGLFSYISMASWLLFIPSETWSWLCRPRNQPDVERAATPAAGAVSASSKLAASVAQAVCAVMLGCVIACNIHSILDRLHDQPMPSLLWPVRDVLMMHQQWSMFARPMYSSSWFIAEAHLADGSTVDLLRGGEPLDRSRPARLAARYPNHRWRKFCNNLAARHPNPAKQKRPKYAAFGQAYAEYLFRVWNERHPAERQIKVLKLICMLQPIGSDTERGEFVDAVVESERAKIEETIVLPDWQTQKNPDPVEEDPDL